MHQPLLADIGVPMIFVQWPLMFCALIPVIAIEAEVTRRQLALPTRKALTGAARANFQSTLIGVPLAWAIMFGVELVTVLPISLAAEKYHWNTQSPLFDLFFVLSMAWAPPSPRGMPPWPIALAAALLLIPTFFLSVRIERRSYRKSWPELETAAVDRSVWYANLASYTLLFLAACAWLGWLVARSR